MERCPLAIFPKELVSYNAITIYSVLLNKPKRIIRIAQIRFLAVQIFKNFVNKGELPKCI